jgi:hypothetical protein
MFWPQPEPELKEQPQDADEAAQANNPLANMKAFNLQNYYIGELTESDENARARESRVTFYLIADQRNPLNSK